MTRVHLIGVCGTAMATLAALLKSNGYDVRGSDQNVYPPMSDFLVQQGITLLQGYRAEHITADLDLVVVGNAISRGNPELEEVLDRKIRYCSLPEAVRDHFLVGSALGRHHRHARQDDDDRPGRLAADGRRRRSEPARRRHCRELRQQLSHRRRPRLRHRGRRVRQRVLRQDGEVPQVSARHRRRQQHRVRSRGHLRRPRRHPAGVHAVRQPDPAARAPAARRRQRRRAGAAHARPLPGRDVRPRGRRRLAGARSAVTGSSTTFRVRRGGVQVGTFEVPLLGAYNVRNALAALAVGAAVGLSTDTMVTSLSRFKGVRRRMQHRGTVRGVAVYDDFAHHPTAIGETLAGVRSAYPDRRIWAIFEPRSATSCRRVFQSDFARALANADRVILPAVFRSTLPDAERLSTEQLVADLKSERCRRPLHSGDRRHRPPVAKEAQRRRPRRRHVERRLRRHSSEAAVGPRAAALIDALVRILPAGDAALSSNCRRASIPRSMPVRRAGGTRSRRASVQSRATS